MSAHYAVKPRLARQAETLDVVAQNVVQVAATDDQKAGVGNLRVNPGRRLKKLALPLAARPLKAAHHREREVLRAPIPTCRCAEAANGRNRSVSMPP